MINKCLIQYENLKMELDKEKKYAIRLKKGGRK